MYRKLREASIWMSSFLPIQALQNLNKELEQGNDN